MILTSSGQKALLSIINWGEFYYIIRRRIGRAKAEEALAPVEQLPVRILSVDNKLVKEAAEIKADYPISYADAFCIATAKRHGGQIFTNNREFESVKQHVSVVWLNAA